jgi:hypothetical protein
MIEGVGGNSSSNTASPGNVTGFTDFEPGGEHLRDAAAAPLFTRGSKSLGLPKGCKSL